MGRVAAATLEQEMGRRSVAAAIGPIKDRAVASSSSATKSITQEMVAEACDTLVRERHPASPPMWLEGSEPPTQSDPDRLRGTEILQEPPLPRRKTASTPRPERGGSPRGAEQGPVPAMFSQSPVVRQKKQLSLRTHVPETEESESNTSGEPGDMPGPKEDPPHLVARPPSDQEGDREGAEPKQEEAMGAEPSAHLELAILNGLDISSFPALRYMSTGASTTVNIPWPPAGMEWATPEWRQKASQPMALLLGGRSGEHYGNWSDALRQRPECCLDPPDTTTRRGIWTARMWRTLRQLERSAETTTGMPPRPPRHHDTKGDMDCQDAQQHGLQGAGWTGRSANNGTPGAGGYERDLEGHSPMKRSATDPRARQGKPPG